MGEVGFEMLKDIPGFQAILKTLVKSQLQHLINQLSEHGDAETIILSVNRCDGTIHQLGSRKGEEFLGYRHDIKTQFLQYCLQSYQEVADQHVVIDETNSEENPTDSGEANNTLDDIAISPSMLPDMASVPDQLMNNMLENNTVRSKNRTFSSQIQRTMKPVYNSRKRKMKHSYETNEINMPTVEREPNDTENMYLVKKEPDDLENDGDVNFMNSSEDFVDDGLSLSNAAEMTAETDNAGLLDNTFAGFDATETGHVFIYRRNSKAKRSYKCQKCGKIFKNGQNLKVHDRMHSGIRPYSCEFCSQKFYQRSHLRCHIRIHTGEKPYECKVCGQRFTQSSAMHSHCRLVHRSRLKS